MVDIEKILDNRPAIRVGGRLFFPLLLFWAFWHHSFWALAASTVGLIASWHPYSHPRSIRRIAGWSIYGNWKGMTNGRPAVRIAALVSGLAVTAVTLWTLWQHQAAVALAGTTIIMVAKAHFVWRLETIDESAGLLPVQPSARFRAGTPPSSVIRLSEKRKRRKSADAERLPGIILRHQIGLHLHRIGNFQKFRDAE